MSDREFGGSDDLSLPKATVQKIISEILAHDSGATFARETRDLLIECCVEFITLVSSEANEIAEKDAKKTIACEHVQTALEQLGYGEYVPEILKVAQDHKNQQVHREKKHSKLEQSGLSTDELIRQQQELFRSATDKFNSAPQDGE
ncbi:histone-fold-containing protein [Eremomyces bilateralis CBS 781.70]|uniref:NCT transcriptional regulatory complex subunit B n=1 Tax=Eremomyces bilateralis CBS 781.70 TaxID=1392243 RepID=A0A6G1G9L2_9PEZI|nr:histone-fold-containing protein [Eremomyces bilateralis CBS 781.70]KAF1814775.1 histone-fold-containing protein [Eremomyces bilateralis CBS 781.70]